MKKNTQENDYTEMGAYKTVRDPIRVQQSNDTHQSPKSQRHTSDSVMSKGLSTGRKGHSPRTIHKQESMATQAQTSHAGSSALVRPNSSLFTRVRMTGSFKTRVSSGLDNVYVDQKYKTGNGMSN